LGERLISSSTGCLKIRRTHPGTCRWPARKCIVSLQLFPSTLHPETHVSLLTLKSSITGPVSFSNSSSLSQHSISQRTKTLSAFHIPRTYLVRQGQTELDLVGGHISVSTALDRTEGVESRTSGASDTEGVHYGGTVGRRGV
jgi:hypothetical protein